MIHAFIRRIASVEVIAMILCTICLIPSIVSADMGAARKDPEASEDCASESAAVPETVAAEELLYGVLELGGFDSPDLIFGSDDGDFRDRFESFYHTDMPRVRDMAFAVSSGICADEIAVVVPEKDGDRNEMEGMLRRHIEEEERIYELYSPEDVSNLKNAYIGDESGFIILIVSKDKNDILETVRECLHSPDMLPPLPENNESSGGSTGNVTECPPESDTGAETSADRDTAGTADKDLPQTEPPQTETAPPETPQTTEPPQTETAPPPETDPPQTEPPVTQSPETTVPTFDDTYYSDKMYEFENALPEREHTPDGFFSDAIFVGDSRLAGIMLYAKPQVAADYSVVALNAVTVFTTKAVDMGGSKVTVADAIRMTKFNKCYLMFGINELS